MWSARRIFLLSLFLIGTVAGVWLAMEYSSQESTTQAPRSRRDGRPVLRVLFIGNSLTYTNDLPGMVAAISEAAGGGPVIEAHALTAGGADLGDHWNNGARELIDEEWDFVVLQQGPSSLPESRVKLLEYARTYAPAIRAAGAVPAFYMVWPEERYSRSFERTCESYRLAAGEVDGLLLPAGEAWLAAWRLDSSLPLYGGDRFHPAPAGTYLAALVITSQLTGRPPMELPDPAQLRLPALDRELVLPDQAHLLKRAATEAIEHESSGSPSTVPAAGTRPAGAAVP